jgi:AraC-like DNA-binding protein
MSNVELTQLARLPLMLLDYAAQRGMNVDSLMDTTSLSTKAIKDPDSRVSLSAQLQLWRAVLKKLADPALGLQVGITVKANQLGIVGYAMSHSETLLEAFKRLSRYLRIISEAITFEMIPGKGVVRLQINTHPSLLALRHPIEAQLAAILTVAREITGQQLVPIGVDLPTMRPTESRAYRDVFRCDLQFGQHPAAIVFTQKQLLLPVVAADATLSGYLLELASRKLDAMRDPNESLADAVRRALWADLSIGKPDLGRTAAQLGISGRTLQRRLRSVGLSYSDVLESLRRELSNELLTDGNLAVADVAFLLGYSEPSAFQRAFRRWRGVSPQQYKRSRVA